MGEYLALAHDWLFEHDIPPTLKVTVGKAVRLQGAGLGARPLAGVGRILERRKQH